MMRIILVLFLAITLRAQTFEVVSVKPHGPSQGIAASRPECKDGRFVSIAPLFMVIRFAYELDGLQVDDLRPKLPAWANSIDGSYDIEAVTGSNVTPAQCRAMTRSLLEDRFQLKSHWEEQTGALRHLVVAKGGPKLVPVADDDQSVGVELMINGNKIREAPGAPAWRGMTMDDVAELAAGQIEPRMPVINKTGLEGLYKVKLAFSLGRGINREFADPDLASALERQLGLKVENATGVIRKFMVDRIEKPSEN